MGLLINEDNEENETELETEALQTLENILPECLRDRDGPMSYFNILKTTTAYTWLLSLCETLDGSLGGEAFEIGLDMIQDCQRVQWERDLVDMSYYDHLFENTDGSLFLALKQGILFDRDDLIVGSGSEHAAPLLDAFRNESDSRVTGSERRRVSDSRSPPIGLSSPIPWPRGSEMSPTSLSGQPSEKCAGIHAESGISISASPLSMCSSEEAVSALSFSESPSSDFGDPLSDTSRAKADDKLIEGIPIELSLPTMCQQQAEMNSTMSPSARAMNYQDSNDNVLMSCSPISATITYDNFHESSPHETKTAQNHSTIDEIQSGESTEKIDLDRGQSPPGVHQDRSKLVRSPMQQFTLYPNINQLPSEYQTANGSGHTSQPPSLSYLSKLASPSSINVEMDGIRIGCQQGAILKTESQEVSLGGTSSSVSSSIDHFLDLPGTTIPPPPAAATTPTTTTTSKILEGSSLGSETVIDSSLTQGDASINIRIIKPPENFLLSNVLTLPDSPPDNNTSGHEEDSDVHASQQTSSPESSGNISLNEDKGCNDTILDTANLDHNNNSSVLFGSDVPKTSVQRQRPIVTVPKKTIIVSNKYYRIRFPASCTLPLKFVPTQPKAEQGPLRLTVNAISPARRAEQEKPVLPVNVLPSPTKAGRKTLLPSSNALSSSPRAKQEKGILPGNTMSFTPSRTGLQRTLFNDSGIGSETCSPKRVSTKKAKLAVAVTNNDSPEETVSRDVAGKPTVPKPPKVPGESARVRAYHRGFNRTEFVRPSPRNSNEALRVNRTAGRTRTPSQRHRRRRVGFDEAVLPDEFLEFEASLNR